MNFFGVVYFFDPISAGDSPGGPAVPAALGFLIYVLLSVVLLDWASQWTGRPVRSGLVIALSQVICSHVEENAGPGGLVGEFWLSSGMSAVRGG